MLAPLTDHIGEFGDQDPKKRTCKKPFYWSSVHQEAFDNVKATLACDVVLAYPDFSKEFELYTDASARQLGAVIVQENRPIAFFSHKLSEVQQKYFVT